MFKFDLKKAVLYTSVGVGCIAVLFAATVAPLGKILPGGHIGASEGAGNAGTEQTENEAVETAAEVNWGLSFRQAGQPPVGNATPEYLAKYNAYYIAGSNGKEDDSKSAKPVYLTFDAGYENGYTAEILDILKEKKVPAAFFLVGNYIEENPELVKRMEAEGHIVGNHTMHHPDMSAIADEEAFKSEIKELEDTYREAVGKEIPKFYRPPQGKYSEANLQQASRLGYTTLFWSLAYVDWLENDQPDETESINLLNKRIHPGAIVLLHSTSKTNSRILGQLIDGWKAQGYEFRSVSELGTGKV
ncbi:MAG: polysaccharide deacetylase family protein [Firmicutes bacterium]|nr:polysaccharide deacetylase family protein [Bacillota bacterium]